MFESKLLAALLCVVNPSRQSFFPLCNPLLMSIPALLFHLFLFCCSLPSLLSPVLPAPAGHEKLNICSHCLGISLCFSLFSHCPGFFGTWWFLNPQISSCFQMKPSPPAISFAPFGFSSRSDKFYSSTNKAFPWLIFLLYLLPTALPAASSTSSHIGWVFISPFHVLVLPGIFFIPATAMLSQFKRLKQRV